MKRLTVLLDFDDVITTYIDDLLNEYNETHSTNYLPKDITFWRINETLNLKEHIFDLVTYDFLVNKVHEKNNSIHWIKTLIDNGHKVYIVSDTQRGLAQSGKRDWLLDRIPYFKKDHIIFIKNKGMINGDIFIDDNITNIRLWQEKNPNGKAILMRSNHNTNKPIGDIPVIDNLGEIYNYI